MEQVCQRLSDSSSTLMTTDGGECPSENNASVELSSPQKCRRELQPPGGSGEGRIVQYFNNFKKSGPPSRFLLFQENAWVDFTVSVSNELTDGFLAGRAVFELLIDGRCYLFDFLRMVRIDTSTGVANSIAWIDVGGQCFFPPGSTTLVQLDDCSHEDKERSDKYSPGVPGAGEVVVRKLFLNRMRRAGSDAVQVTSVYKCSYSGLSGSWRLKAFQMMKGMTKEARGDANVKFGWYGASSASGAANVIKHGFGKANSGVHGLGLHLSPANSPHGSSLLCRADAGGEKHMVLCRVVMGNAERVEAGSLQCRPSSDEFDTGIDNLQDPKWYVVWSTGMNTRIIPEYVVSFKTLNQQAQAGTWRLSFPKLLREMGRSLPSARTRALEVLYNQHKTGKLSKDVFIRYVRTIVGDKLLASTIRRIRGH